MRERAVLAAGCFWGVEDLFRKLPGVLDTTVGYASSLQGTTSDEPTYEKVKRGDTGFAESIEIVFDSTVVSYADLLRLFFRLHDPTTLNRQGGDRGTQYRSAIFLVDESQRSVAEASKLEAERSGRWQSPIVTEIAPLSKFAPAEGYHQDYLQKNPGGYTCHWLRD